MNSLMLSLQFLNKKLKTSNFIIKSFILCFDYQITYRIWFRGQKDLSAIFLMSPWQFCWYLLRKFALSLLEYHQEDAALDNLQIWLIYFSEDRSWANRRRYDPPKGFYMKLNLSSFVLFEPQHGLWLISSSITYWVSIDNLDSLFEAL